MFCYPWVQLIDYLVASPDPDYLKDGEYLEKDITDDEDDNNNNNNNNGETNKAKPDRTPQKTMWSALHYTELLPIFPKYLPHHQFHPNFDDPKLKLFFSVDHIANGEWIQFHGPGTKIFNKPQFKRLAMGSLLVTQGIYGDDDHTAIHPDDDPDEVTEVDFRISIQWSFDD